MLEKDLIKDLRGQEISSGRALLCLANYNKPVHHERAAYIGNVMTLDRACLGEVGGDLQILKRVVVELFLL